MHILWALMEVASAKVGDESHGVTHIIEWGIRSVRDARTWGEAQCMQRLGPRLGHTWCPG